MCASVQQPPTTTAVERCELSGRNREPNVPVRGASVCERKRIEAAAASDLHAVDGSSSVDNDDVVGAQWRRRPVGGWVGGDFRGSG